MSTYAYSCGRSIPLFAGRFQPLADKDRETASVVMKYLGLSRTTIELWFRKHETSWLDSLSDNVTPGIGPKQTEKQWQQVRILIFGIFREFSGLVLIRIGGAFRVTVLNWLDGELGSMGGIGNPPRCAGLRYAAAPLRRVGVLGWLRGLWLAG